MGAGILAQRGVVHQWKNGRPIPWRTATYFLSTEPRLDNGTPSPDPSPVAAPESLGWKRRIQPGFIGTAGPLWTRKEDEGWAYGLHAQAQHLNAVGVVHGGALCTLMDHAISTVAWEAGGRVPCVTLQLDTHFIAAARAGQLIEARASVRHRTPGLLFMEGRLSVSGTLVMSAQAIMKLLRAPR